MSVQIQMRRDSEADWVSENPTLAEGEIGYVTDTGKYKIGDGSTAWTSLHYTGVVALVDEATIATDVSLGDEFRVTLGDNRTLGAPSNAYDGKLAIWRFKQDGTGSRTITLNAIFRLGTDIASITLTTTPNKADYMAAIYNSTDTKWDVVAFVKGY